MIIGTSEMTSNIDNACVKELGIPMIVMMENAVHSAIKNIELSKYKKFTIVCGTGNNGGDGLGIARHIYVRGGEVYVFIIGKEEKLSECSEINYSILKNMDINVSFINSDKEEGLNDLAESIKSSDAVIDCIFGTGLKREIKGIYRDAVELMNKHSKYTYAIDIPSGIKSDSGDILGVAVKADKTISFEFFKRGFLNYSADGYTGEIVVEGINVPVEIKNKFHNNEFITERKEVSTLIKKREKNAHKGNFGKVNIIAGSKGFYGAACIAAQSSLKMGSGLVTLITYPEAQDILAMKMTEVMTRNLSEEKRVSDILRNSSALGIGPGMGNNEETYKVLERVLNEVSCPVVIDADAISVLEGRKDIIKNCKKEILITPHPGEISRITGKSIKEINSDRINIAKEAAKELSSIVLLKGNRTIITDGERVYVNPTGNSAMANGGMGDCLTGIITSLAGYKIPLFEAAVSGAYIHGLAGDILSKEKYSVNAGDIMKILPELMKKLSEE